MSILHIKSSGSARDQSTPLPLPSILVAITPLTIVSSHDEYCVDCLLSCRLPEQDVPSTGLDKWYQLEARSQRSNIQGSIRLKLWLSTREDHGQACTQNNFDNWTDVRRHERLLTIFADYEMSLIKSVSTCQRRIILCDIDDHSGPIFRPTRLIIGNIVRTTTWLELSLVCQNDASILEYVGPVWHYIQGQTLIFNTKLARKTQ